MSNPDPLPVTNYYAVVTAGEGIRCKEFASAVELAVYLRELIELNKSSGLEMPVHVRLFAGQELKFTTGPNPYMVVPFHDPQLYALFGHEDSPGPISESDVLVEADPIKPDPLYTENTYPEEVEEPVMDGPENAVGEEYEMELAEEEEDDEDEDS